MNRKAKKKVQKFIPHYSGRHSNKFWGSIPKIKDDTARSCVYSMGCVIQSLEWQIRVISSETKDKEIPHAKKR